MPLLQNDTPPSDNLIYNEPNIKPTPHLLFLWDPCTESFNRTERSRIKIYGLILLQLQNTRDLYSEPQGHKFCNLNERV